MKRYIIGVDGGGTKTLGVLFDLHGNAKKQVKSGFANFNVDTKKTIEHVKEILQLLTEGINLDQIEMIQIGIAGYTNFEGKELLLKELRENYLTEVSIVTDAEIALYSVKKDSDSDAIMVLGGTGSVIMLEHHGEIHFIGGFGHLLGDEGSGYHLSITALKNIIEQYEKNEGITDLSKSILINIGASAYSDIKKFVYNNPKSIVAELSPFIAKHAEDGNEEAIKLFKQEGILLAEQALRAYHTLNSKEEVLIGFTGGFLLNAPYVKETLIQELDRNKVKYTLDVFPQEPVYGAYYLAMRHLNKRWKNG